MIFFKQGNVIGLQNISYLCNVSLKQFNIDIKNKLFNYTYKLPQTRKWAEMYTISFSSSNHNIHNWRRHARHNNALVAQPQRAAHAACGQLKLSVRMRLGLLELDEIRIGRGQIVERPHGHVSRFAVARQHEELEVEIIY